VTDTNVLVYATFEDSEHHREIYGVLATYDKRLIRLAFKNRVTVAP